MRPLPSRRCRLAALLAGSAATAHIIAAAAPPPPPDGGTPWLLFRNDTAPSDREGFYSPETTQHWPAGRVIRNVSHPSLVPFPAAAGPGGAAAGTGTAVIVAPGGAYKWLTWDAEGVDIALWLNSLGISAYVLKCEPPTGQ
eukprot:SAG22_NODE_4606_length_1219_cov_1.709821_1_plen_141_part_00